MTEQRALDVANQPWKTPVDRQTLALTLRRTNTLQTVEPLSDAVTTARDAMRNGNLDLANVYASRHPHDVGHTTLARAHLLLTRIGLRQANLPRAVHHMTELRNLYRDHRHDSDMPNPGHVELIEGELTYARFVAGDQAVDDVLPFFERARNHFANEVFGLGRFEAARRISTMHAFGTGGLDLAVHGLRATLAATAYPLLLPVHYRTAISLAKLGIIGDDLQDQDFDNCRRAAEFFSTSPAFDRYWYAEALLVLHLAERKTATWHQLLRSLRPADAPPLTPLPLELPATHEWQAIGRPDKVALITEAATKVDPRPLLLD
ncbi:hypothetical protein ACFQ1S_08855 [Kibdelosporangium lantanae]|uniref:Uncharacterized protein n=1 Tax=Kibdelosporangium lantanae TaxID=1497396 RepID=A0ABW3M6Y9_9PSEU